MRKRKTFAKLGLLFIILLISLSSFSASYSLWSKDLNVTLTINTGTWDTCIKIRKTLEEGCPNFCEDKFTLTIEVMNNGSSILTAVEVTDSLGDNVQEIFSTPSKGSVSWSDNDLTWTIGDLIAEELVTLEICIKIVCEYGDYIPAEITSPPDDVYINVPRYDHDSGEWGTGPYYVEHNEGHRIVKYENLEPNLGEDGKVQTDVFIIEAIDGGVKVKTTTKAGKNAVQVILNGEGDIEVDDSGFTIELVSIDDCGGGKFRYNITVTSDDVGGRDSPALSHVEFDFGYYCPVEINAGATVTAESTWCSLEATTECINVVKEKFGGLISPPLPYSTSWAEDCCEYSN